MNSEDVGGDKRWWSVHSVCPNYRVWEASEGGQRTEDRAIDLSAWGKQGLCYRDTPQSPTEKENARTSGSPSRLSSQSTRFSNPWGPHRKGSSGQARTPVVQAATSRLLPLSLPLPRGLPSGALSIPTPLCLSLEVLWSFA